MRRYIAQRRRRERHLGADLFSDPAWDILLELFVSERQGSATTVTNACLASMAPATTALRWISRLEERGLVKRRKGTVDRRTALLLLTPSGREGVSRWVEEALAA